jgi:hypothetical protein
VPVRDFGSLAGPASGMTFCQTRKGREGGVTFVFWRNAKPTKSGRLAGDPQNDVSDAPEGLFRGSSDWLQPYPITGHFI